MFNFKKVLHSIGLYTRKDIDAKNEQIKKLRNDLEECSEEAKKIPFEFDKLLSKYSDNQLNALFYKLISLCYKDSSKHRLLNRWRDRLKTAKPRPNKKLNLQN